jgi:transcriptional regulator
LHVAPADATFGEEEWRPFVESQGFGHLIASGRDRSYPVVVPTQFVLDGDRVFLHLVAANPLFGALAENPMVVLSIAGDWAFIPSAWKAIEGEDPELGIPTTYYGAVQLVGSATVHTDRGAIADILRRQLATFQPEVAVADPEEVHVAKLGAIVGIEIALTDVRAKFKYGGNVDAAHREAVFERLEQRAAPGDRAAAERGRGRHERGGSPPRP